MISGFMNKIGIQDEQQDDPVACESFCEDFNQRITQISESKPDEYMHLFHIKNLRKIPKLNEMNA